MVTLILILIYIIFFLFSFLNQRELPTGETCIARAFISSFLRCCLRGPPRSGSRPSPNFFELVFFLFIFFCIFRSFLLNTFLFHSPSSTSESSPPARHASLAPSSPLSRGADFEVRLDREVDRHRLFLNSCFF